MSDSLTLLLPEWWLTRGKLRGGHCCPAGSPACRRWQTCFKGTPGMSPITERVKIASCCPAFSCWSCFITSSASDSSRPSYRKNSTYLMQNTSSTLHQANSGWQGSCTLTNYSATPSIHQPAEVHSPLPKTMLTSSTTPSSWCSSTSDISPNKITLFTPRRKSCSYIHLLHTLRICW